MLAVPIGGLDRIGGSHLGDAQGVVSVKDDNFSPGQQPAVQQRVDGFVDLAVELNHGARSKIEDVAQPQPPAAETQSYRQLDVHQEVEFHTAVFGARENGGGRGGHGFFRFRFFRAQRSRQRRAEVHFHQGWSGGVFAGAKIKGGGGGPGRSSCRGIQAKLHFSPGRPQGRRDQAGDLAHEFYGGFAMIGKKLGLGSGRLTQENLGQAKDGSRRKAETQFPAQASGTGADHPEIVITAGREPGGSIGEGRAGERRSADLSEDLSHAFRPGLNMLQRFGPVECGCGVVGHFDFSLGSLAVSDGSHTRSSTLAARTLPRRAGSARKRSTPAISSDAGSETLRARGISIPGASAASALTGTRTSLVPSST